MPPETTITLANEPEASAGAGKRLIRAIVVTAAAWWLIPRLFPYLSLEIYLERFVPPSEWTGILILAGGFVPYLVMGVGAYFYPPPRTATDADAVETPPPSALVRWSLRFVVALLLGGMVLLAFTNRFVADDAFISFRYARNLVEGHGLVFNPGERVEGYTNFLWVLVIAAGMKLGFEPVDVSQWVGLTCFLGTLALTYRTARLLLHSSCWALVTLVLVGTHYSVLAFATSGLETSLITFLLAAACSVVVGAHAHRRWRKRDLIGLSLIVSAGILTRMDFAVFGFGLVVVALSLSRQSSSIGHSAPRSLGPYPMPLPLLLGPLMAVLAAWLVWKWWYYEALLPNTYYAKRAGEGAISHGLQYLGDFGRSYRYWLPSLFVLLGAAVQVRRRQVLSVFVLLIVGWLGYVVAMGGDFIEYRLLVPIVPSFMILLTWTLAQLTWTHRFYLPAFVLLWVVHGSVAHYRTYGWDAHRAEPVAHLRRQTTEAFWAEAGRTLHQLFGGTDVRIATTCAGILPFNARLLTLDMHGLTDPEVARHGRKVNDRPGHKRIADEAVMRRRGVHLVIGHPRIERIATLDRLPLERIAACAQSADPGTEADIVAIPISGRDVILVWYLTRHPAVEEAIEREGWRLFSVTVTASAEADDTVSIRQEVTSLNRSRFGFPASRLWPRSDAGSGSRIPGRWRTGCRAGCSRTTYTALAFGAIGGGRAAKSKSMWPNRRRTEEEGRGGTAPPARLGRSPLRGTQRGTRRRAPRRTD